MNSKRATCGTCLRPRSTCICQWITRVATGTGLLVLQHPMEASNAKNTARLLHLSLPGSALAVGEKFDEGALSALLDKPRRAVLLYPETPGDASLGIAPAPPFEPAWADNPASLLLVVLDATWRKSRKMLYVNRALQALPRLALHDVPASQYRIRKAHAPGQLSTFEATVHALARIEGDETRYAPLLAAFDGFIGQQQALASREAV